MHGVSFSHEAWSAKSIAPTPSTAEEGGGDGYGVRSKGRI